MELICTLLFGYKLIPPTGNKGIKGSCVIDIRPFLAALSVIALNDGGLKALFTREQQVFIIKGAKFIPESNVG